MTISEFTASLKSEPMFIAPHRVPGLVAVLNRTESAMRDELTAGLEEASKRPELRLYGRVAVLPVAGVMAPSTDGIMRLFGFVGADDIQRMAMDAAARPDVGAVVLSIDSPGGSVMQTPETAAAIRQLRTQKPVIAHTSGLMCSAAYYIAAGASAIYSTPSAIVGSIGTYMAMLDWSAAYDAAGVKVDLIKSTDTPLKAAAYPGTSLTPEQRADLQGIVDHLQAGFAQWVSSNRRQVQPSAMRGQWMPGDMAKASGLVDSLTTLDKAVSDAAKIAI